MRSAYRTVNSARVPSGEIWGSPTERRWNRSALASPSAALGGGTCCAAGRDTAGFCCASAGAAAPVTKAASASVADSRALFPEMIVMCPSRRSEEYTSELQSLMRISYAVFFLKKNTINKIGIAHKSTHVNNRHYVSHLMPDTTYNITPSNKI